MCACGGGAKSRKKGSWADRKKKNATWRWQWALPVHSTSPLPTYQPLFLLHEWHDMNFFLVWIMVKSQTDRSKAMHEPTVHRHRCAQKGRTLFLGGLLNKWGKFSPNFSPPSSIGNGYGSLVVQFRKSLRRSLKWYPKSFPKWSLKYIFGGSDDVRSGTSEITSAITSAMISEVISEIAPPSFRKWKLHNHDNPNFKTSVISISNKM